MNKPICALFFIFLALQTSIGQIIFYDSDPKIETEEFIHLGKESFSIVDSIRHFGINTRKAEIYTIGQDRYLLVDGTFDVFKWTNGKWNNLYKGIFFGYNFWSKKFIIDGKIYSYGGYGYWNSHGQVIQFLPNRDEWELVEIYPELPFGLASMQNKQLVIYTPDSTIQVNIKDKSFKSKALFTHDFKDIDITRKFTLELKNFTIFHGMVPNFLIDKKDGILYESKLSPFQYLETSLEKGLVQVRADSIYCYTPEFKVLAAYNASNEFQFYKSVDSKPESHGLSKSDYFTIIIGSGLFLGFVFIYLRKKVKTDQFSTEIERNKDIDHPIGLKLLSFDHDDLSQDELDEIFEINHILSPESKRFRRSQLIKEINQAYKMQFDSDLISRLQDPTDKRKYIYKIDRKA